MSEVALPAWALAVADHWALLAWGIVAAAVVERLLVRPWVRRGAGAQAQTPQRISLALLLVAVVTDAWPALGFGPAGLTWAMHLRGTLGDLSVVAVVAALASLLGGRARRADAHTARLDREVLAGASALVGLSLMVLHIGSVGVGHADLYRLGYTGWGLPVAVTAVAVWAAWRTWWRTSLALAAALAMWGLGVPESTNLWDALVDPWWTLWCAAVLLAALRRRLRSH